MHQRFIQIKPSGFYKFITAIFIFCTIVSCSKEAEKEAITDSFNNIISPESGTKVSDYLDQESIAYFSRIMDLAQEEPFQSGTFLTEYPECRYTTSVIIEIVRQFFRELEIDDKIGTAIFAARLLGAGPFGFEGKDKYSIYDFKKIGKDKAIVNVQIKVSGNTNILSEYHFNKENDRWKLDAPSTFKLIEKILAAKWRNIGGAEYEFAISYLKQTESESTFRIRSQKYFTEIN